jgi:hypothetical protein
MSLSHDLELTFKVVERDNSVQVGIQDLAYSVHY